MRILFIGDIFGNVGRRVLAENLERLREEHHIDVCVANGENAAGGRGITQALSRKMHKFGIDVITGGNHSLSSSDAADAMESDGTLLRPLNLPPGNAGMGRCVFRLADGRKLGVINLIGRTYLNEKPDCPFRAGRFAVQEMVDETKNILIDIHAETTSEKAALANYLDGRVSAVLGTHTHVQTADERILPNGTAFITDVGMTGPEDSVIGMKKRLVIRRFLLQSHVRFEPATEGPMLNAVVVDIDDDGGRARTIKRIYERPEFR